MKNLIITFISVWLLGYAFASAQNTNSPQIKITEIGANEPADTEWIQIQNKSKSAVNITGWKFFENGTNHKLNSFRGEFTLEPDEKAVIANKADLFLKKYPTYSGTIFDSSWSGLKEDGEEIGLKDTKENTIELFIYSAAQVKSVFDFGAILPTTTQNTTTATQEVAKSPVITPPPTTPSPQTILPLQNPSSLFNLRGYFVFVPENFEQAETSKKTTTKSTKAVSNTKTDEYFNGDLSDSVKITEIYPNTVAGENEDEWIEIYNAGKDAVNLGNWTLSNIRKKNSPFVISDAISLEPSEYFVFNKAETKITLNNEKDEVFLGDFNGNTIDSVPYEKSKKGFSYALIRFGEGDEWEWVDEPTPSAQNQSYEKISGEISQIPEENSTGEAWFTVRTADSSVKKIIFTRETLDINVSQAILKQGSSVVLQAKKGSGDEYILRKIDNVAPPTENPTPKKSTVPWILGTVVMAIIIFWSVKRIVKYRTGPR